VNRMQPRPKSAANFLEVLMQCYDVLDLFANDIDAIKCIATSNYAKTA